MGAATRSIDDAEVVRVLKALADPKRFRMVEEIAAAGELSCGQVAERFELAQPTISHHLKILTDAGIVVSRQEAKHHFISVNRELLRAVVDLLPTRFLVEPRIEPVSSRKTARRS
jgi:ArsR family transcriptional regulator